MGESWEFRAFKAESLFLVGSLLTLLHSDSWKANRETLRTKFWQDSQTSRPARDATEGEDLTIRLQLPHHQEPTDLQYNLELKVIVSTATLNMRHRQ